MNAESEESNWHQYPGEDAIENWSSTEFREWLSAGLHDWNIKGENWRAFHPVRFSLARELEPQFRSWFHRLPGRLQRHLRAGIAEAVSVWQPDSRYAYRTLTYLMHFSVVCTAPAVVAQLRPKLVGGVLGQPRTEGESECGHDAVLSLDAFAGLDETRTLIGDLFFARETPSSFLPTLFVSLLRTSHEVEELPDLFPRAVERLCERLRWPAHATRSADLMSNFVSRVGLEWIARNLRHLSRWVSTQQWFVSALVVGSRAPLAYIQFGGGWGVCHRKEEHNNSGAARLTLPTPGREYAFLSMIDLADDERRSRYHRRRGRIFGSIPLMRELTLLIGPDRAREIPEAAKQHISEYGGLFAE